MIYTYNIFLSIYYIHSSFLTFFILFVSIPFLIMNILLNNLEYFAIIYFHIKFYFIFFFSFCILFSSKVLLYSILYAAASANFNFESFFMFHISINSIEKVEMILFTETAQWSITLAVSFILKCKSLCGIILSFVFRKTWKFMKLKLILLYLVLHDVSNSFIIEDVTWCSNLISILHVIYCSW